MSRSVVRDRGTVPIGGYVRYLDADAGFTVQHPYYDWAKNFAEAERKKRGLPLPWNWDEVFDAGVCKATPQACFEVPDDPNEQSPTLVEMAKGFTRSMVNWVRSGFAVVDYETYKARYGQCSGSPTNPRCPQFTTFAGTGVTRCGRCGCTSLKLFLKPEKCPLGKW